MLTPLKPGTKGLKTHCIFMAAKVLVLIMYIGSAFSQPPKLIKNNSLLKMFYRFLIAFLFEAMHHDCAECGIFRDVHYIYTAYDRFAE